MSVADMQDQATVVKTSLKGKFAIPSGPGGEIVKYGKCGVGHAARLLSCHQRRGRRPMQERKEVVRT